jgi:hypothetical protein
MDWWLFAILALRVCMCVCLCIFRRRRRTSLVVFTDGVRIKKIYLSTELCAHLCTRIGGHTTSLVCVCVCVWVAQINVRDLSFDLFRIFFDLFKSHHHINAFATTIIDSHHYSAHFDTHWCRRSRRSWHPRVGRMQSEWVDPNPTFDWFYFY